MPLSRAGGIFDRLAPRYDRGNRVISLGLDMRWKRRAVARLAPREGLWVDCGAGTGDLARLVRDEAGPRARVVAVDASRAMLGAGSWPNIDAVAGDAQRLPLPAASAQGMVTGFLLRNLADLPAFFSEAARVVRPGGPLVVLEASYPRGRIRRAMFWAWFHGVVPVLGAAATGRPGAYRYLSRSLRGFPPPAGLQGMAEAAGFRFVGLEVGRWTGAFVLLMQRA